MGTFGVWNFNSFQRIGHWISLVLTLTLSQDFTNHLILPLHTLLLFFTKNLCSPASDYGKYQYLNVSDALEGHDRKKISVNTWVCSVFQNQGCEKIRFLKFVTSKSGSASANWQNQLIYWQKGSFHKWELSFHYPRLLQALLFFSVSLSPSYLNGWWFFSNTDQISFPIDFFFFFSKDEQFLHCCRFEVHDLLPSPSSSCKTSIIISGVLCTGCASCREHKDNVLLWLQSIQNLSPILPPLLFLTSCCLYFVVVESISVQQGVQYRLHSTNFLKFLLLFVKCSFFLITSHYFWMYIKIFSSRLSKGLIVVPVTFEKETFVIKGPVWGSGQASMVEQLNKALINWQSAHLRSGWQHPELPLKWLLWSQFGLLNPEVILPHCIKKKIIFPVPGSEEEQTFLEAEEHKLSVKHEIQSPAENEQNKSQLSIKFSKEKEQSLMTSLLNSWAWGKLQRSPQSQHCLFCALWLFHLAKGDKFPLKWSLVFMREKFYHQNHLLKSFFWFRRVSGLVCSGYNRTVPKQMA